jgi:hypothetical protein
MVIHEFFDIKLSNTLSLLISGTTLFLAYRIYRNFDIKKTHINKQLSVILSLVEEINNTQIQVGFYSKIPTEILLELPEQVRPQNKEDAVFDSWYYSLFLIASGNIGYQQQDVYISSDIMNVLPFLHYMNNPLLPSKIADKLHKFYSPFNNLGSFEFASDKYVVLSSTNKHENVRKFQYPSMIDTYKNWDNFIICARELKKEIKDWLETYGSKDINFNTYMQRSEKV